MTQCWGESWNAGAQTWFPQNTGLPAGLSNVDSLVSFFPLLLSCSHVEGLVSHTHLAVVLQAHAPEAGGPTRVSNSVHSAQAVVLTQARRSGILVLTHSLAKCSRVDVHRGWTVHVGCHPGSWTQGLIFLGWSQNPRIPSSASGVGVALPSTTPHFVANLLFAGEI